MMIKKTLLLPVLLLGLLVASGCRSPRAADRAAAEVPIAQKSVRSNSYSLLYDLLDKQRNVSKILIIKKDRPELKDLIKRIAKTCGQGADMIDAFAKEDPEISLKLLQLPPAEVATRDAIEDTKTKLLLHTSGAEFESNLLLTQIESMNYGAHLARVTARFEHRTEWCGELNNLGLKLQRLHEQAVALALTGRQ